MDKFKSDLHLVGCKDCSQDVELGFDFTMAFQPIVNINTGQIFAHEALVRGLNNESSGQVFQYVNEQNRYRFDQICRVKAIELAAQLKIDCLLSINFMANAICDPKLCIQTTLEAAELYEFPLKQILFEITEGEKVENLPLTQSIICHYQSSGFLTAIDDFGSGYAGLSLLADLQTDLIKLDIALVRDIHTSKSKQAIVKGILQVCRDLNIQIIAEGIETRDELNILRDFGVELFQGYFFAKPAFRALAEVYQNALT